MSNECRRRPALLIVYWEQRAVADPTGRAYEAVAYLAIGADTYCARLERDADGWRTSLFAAAGGGATPRWASRCYPAATPALDPLFAHLLTLARCDDWYPLADALLPERGAAVAAP
ncbi:MAG TPA: hypothetical protein VFL91_25275 [Thermomicrobiales bacterium]|nr:hypothetical protein [Thermomicrobiales bacterium]